jgi:hypothetical protein
LFWVMIVPVLLWYENDCAFSPFSGCVAECMVSAVVVRERLCLKCLDGIYKPTGKRSEQPR